MGTLKILLITLLVLALVLAGCSKNNDSGANGATAADNTPVVQKNTTSSGNDNINNDVDLSVRCSKDSECGSDVISEPYCFQGNAVAPVTKMKCIYPGTIKSYCTKEKTELTTLCDRDEETCRKGKCLVVADLPCSDSDGGKNYYKRGEIVDALFESHSDDCEDDVLTEWYCSNDGKGFARSIEYTCPERCVTGACVD